MTFSINDIQNLPASKTVDIYTKTMKKEFIVRKYKFFNRFISKAFIDFVNPKTKVRKSSILF